MERGGDNDDWIGDTLGIPRDGPGSIASWPRRIAAFLFDQAVLGMRSGITMAWLPLLPRSEQGGWTRLGIFLGIWLVNLVMLPVLTGRTIGKALLCLRIRRLDEDRRPTWRGAIVRGLWWILPFVPFITMDDDRRHVGDRKGGTVVVDTWAWWWPSQWPTRRRTAAVQSGADDAAG